MRHRRANGIDLVSVQSPEKQKSQWQNFQSESESKGRRPNSWIRNSETESKCSLPPFVLFRSRSRRQVAHPHWGRLSALLSLPIQVLISSVKTLTDTPTLTFNQISGKYGPVKWTKLIISFSQFFKWLCSLYIYFFLQPSHSISC